MLIMRFYSIAYMVILAILLFGLVSVHAEVPSGSPSETPSESSVPSGSSAPSGSSVPSDTSVPNETSVPSESPVLNENSAPSESPVPTETLVPTLLPDPEFFGNCQEPSACDDGSCGTCKTSRGAGDPGCSCSRCACKVCEIDAYCCIKQWDPICVEEANTLCDCQIFPTQSPSSSPSVSSAPSYKPYPSNLYFTLANQDWQLQNITGVYAANTEGMGGPPSLMFSGESTPIGLTVTSCSNDRKLYWVDQANNAVKYASLDQPMDSANVLYSYLDARGEYFTTIYGVLGIAINEAQGKLFIGANGGLYMAELDGSSTYATVLEQESKDIPALTLDPATGYLYYGGREYSEVENREKYFVRELRPPYDKPSRELYTPEYFRNKAQPRDIAVDAANDILYFTDNINVYKAALDGTSPQPQLLFSNSAFRDNNSTHDDYYYYHEQDKVRTLEYHMGRLYMGVFGSEYTRLYEGNPSDPASGLVTLYDISISGGYNSGIRGIVVSDCPSPTASPTPCGDDQQLTTLVSPVSSTVLGVGAVAFVIDTQWATEQIESIGVDIEKLGTASTEWEPLESFTVDPALGTNGVHVIYRTFIEAGTYQWRTTIAVTGDPCQTEETTENTQFTLV